MKNTFFLQGEVQGAASVKISEFVKDAPAALALEYPVFVEMMGNVEAIMEMVYAAYEDGAKFGFTHKNKEMKALFCDALDSLLENEINTAVEQLVKDGNLDRMAKWSLSDECRETIVNLFNLRQDLVNKGAQRVAAGIERRKATEVNKSEVKAQNKNQNKEENVQMTNVQINGVQITVDQVITTMAAQNLFIGGMATTMLGVGQVVGFEATQNGMLVQVLIGEEVKKLMVSKVKGGVHEIEVPVAQQQAQQVDQLVAQSRAAVDSIIENGEQWDSNKEEILFEAREQLRQAERDQWNANRQAKGQANSNSAAAQRILAAAGRKLEQGGGTQAQQQRTNNNGAATRRPVQGQQQQNQNNGGNVQMQNNTRGAQQDRPVQGVAGGSRSVAPRQQAQSQAPARSQQPARRPEPQQAQAPAQANNRAATRRPSGNAPANTGGAATANTGASNRRPGGARLNAGAPVMNEGGNQRYGTQQRRGLGLRADAPVVNARNSYTAWYENTERFPNTVSGEDFEATRQNEVLGITDAKFWTPEAYNARFNRETQESELAVLEIEMGAVSFEFRLRYSSNPEAKSPWYCNNISFIEGKNGRDGRWYYTVAVQNNRYAVIVDDNYKVHMATDEDFKDPATKKLIQYVGDGKWSNQRIYGLNMSEEVIAQVMRWAAFGWTCIQEGTAE